MSRAGLSSWDVAAAVLLAALTIAHYSLPAHVLWIHSVLFWLFQVPVLIGGMRGGIRGGLTLALVTTAVLLPHAIGLSQHHGLSANAIWTDLASLLIIGVTTGWLRDRWRQEQKRGERMRDLRSIDRVLTAVRRDVGQTSAALRGQLTSLEPLRDRTPALGSCVRMMDMFLTPLETLSERLQVLRVDPKIGLVRLDRVLRATEIHLRRCPMPAPLLTLDWRCPPPVVPVSVTSLSTALATIALHMLPHASGVLVTISREPGWAVMDLRPRGLLADDGASPFPPLLASEELAIQVIAIHGGRVEDGRNEGDSPYVRIRVPSTLRIRPQQGETSSLWDSLPSTLDGAVGSSS